MLLELRQLPVKRGQARRTSNRMAAMAMATREVLPRCGVGPRRRTRVVLGLRDKVPLGRVHRGKAYQEQVLGGPLELAI